MEQEGTAACMGDMEELEDTQAQWAMEGCTAVLTRHMEVMGGTITELGEISTAHSLVMPRRAQGQHLNPSTVLFKW